MAGRGCRHGVIAGGGSGGSKRRDARVLRKPVNIWDVGAIVRDRGRLREQVFNFSVDLNGHLGGYFHGGLGG